MSPPPRPTPEISWSKVSGDLPAKRTSFLHYQKTLRIVNVSEADAGEYRCLARNPLGSVHHTIHVMVKGVSLDQSTLFSQRFLPLPLINDVFLTLWPSAALLFPAAPYWIRGPSRNLVLAPAESGVLTCRASGTPKPSITWAMNGISIESEENSVLHLCRFVCRC